MKALSPAGLCDQMPPGVDLWQDDTGPALPWSPSPVTTISYKSTCCERRFSRESGTFPLGNTVNTRTLEHTLRRPTRSWTYLRRPTEQTTARPSAAAHGGPAAQRPFGSEQPGTARRGQLRAARERPAGSGGLPPTRKDGRTGRPYGSAPILCGADSRRRPEAREAAGNSERRATRLTTRGGGRRE